MVEQEDIENPSLGSLELLVGQALSHDLLIRDLRHDEIGREPAVGNAGTLGDGFGLLSGYGRGEQS